MFGRRIIIMEIMTVECKSLPGNIDHKAWLQNCSKGKIFHKIGGFEMAPHQDELRSGG